jgi:hypothetical protein
MDKPALVANSVGSGKTLLIAYPLKPIWRILRRHLTKPESTHRIYEAFREWTGVKTAFHSDQPSVEVTALERWNQSRICGRNQSQFRLTNGNDLDVGQAPVGSPD